jgi:hypothetical protein
MTKYASECTEGVGQILNLQNTFNRYCDEIRMKIQTENFFGSLISTRLVQHILVGFGQINVLVRVALWNKVVNGHINQYYLPMEYWNSQILYNAFIHWLSINIDLQNWILPCQTLNSLKLYHQNQWLQVKNDSFRHQGQYIMYYINKKNSENMWLRSKL